MPLRHEPRVAHTLASLYRSSSCLIGTHDACTQSVPAEAPDGVPVIYEACNCTCHTPTVGRNARPDAPQ